MPWMRHHGITPGRRQGRWMIFAAEAARLRWRIGTRLGLRSAGADHRQIVGLGQLDRMARPRPARRIAICRRPAACALMIPCRARRRGPPVMAGQRDQRLDILIVNSNSSRLYRSAARRYRTAAAKNAR
jgi:hypothetical protein